MGWLVCEDRVLAAAQEGGSRLRLGYLEGAVILRPPVVVHTLGGATRAGCDVAWCGREATDGERSALVVRRMTSLGPWRVARPMLRPGAVVVAPHGAFERWAVRVGDRLELRGGGE
jgi:hypothetical protein